MRKINFSDWIDPRSCLPCDGKVVLGVWLDEESPDKDAYEFICQIGGLWFIWNGNDDLIEDEEPHFWRQFQYR